MCSLNQNFKIHSLANIIHRDALDFASITDNKYLTLIYKKEDYSAKYYPYITICKE